MACKKAALKAEMVDRFYATYTKKTGPKIVKVRCSQRGKTLFVPERMMRSWRCRKLCETPIEAADEAIEYAVDEYDIKWMDECKKELAMWKALRKTL